ncbi:MAG: AMIN domain-containing protein [Gemmatimonadaceae bacterium]
MRRIGTLFAAAVVALGAGAAGATSALGARPDLPAALESAVTSLSIVPGTEHAEVIIGVSGPVTVRDFTLASPDKIVIDITGATLGIPPSTYDEANRGGIVDIRYSQYRKNVVRVVLTLDEPHKYNMVRYPNEIRLKVRSRPDEPVLFVAWHTGNAPVAVAQSGKPGAAAPATSATAPKTVDKPAPKVAEKTPEKAPAKPSGNMWALTEAGLDSTTGATVVPPRGVSAGKPTGRPTPAAPAARVPAPQPDPEAVSDPLDEPDPLPVPRRATERPRPRAPEPRVIVDRPRRSTQPRITVAWQQAPIRDVIAAFALFSGRTIVVGKNVNATVDAEIADQPWDVAMSAILAAHGLAAQEDHNGIIVVDTYEAIASRVAAEPLSTRTIRLNYTRAPVVAQMVTQRLSRDCSRFGGRAPGASNTTVAEGGQSITLDLRCPVRGAVTADSLTNSISVTDVPSNLAQLDEYARGLDVRQPQVSIRAKIILIDRTQLDGMGLRYDLATRNQYFNTIIPRPDPSDPTGQRDDPAPGRVLLGGNAISAIANASQRIASATLGLVYSTAIGAFDFTTFLEALQESSLLDVQSEPSVVTLNNRTANLTAGTQVPVRVIDAGGAQAGQQGGLVAARATVQFRQTGIILNVTPSITANRQVQMRVHAENSDVQFAPGDAGAIFPTQSVDNELLVGDGETAVMGGLTQTTIRVSKSGIPLLVDLPIIGRIFGVTNRQESKRDLLILITPHIVDEGQAAPGEPRRDR